MVIHCGDAGTEPGLQAVWPIWGFDLATVDRTR